MGLNPVIFWKFTIEKALAKGRHKLYSILGLYDPHLDYDSSKSWLTGLRGLEAAEFGVQGFRVLRGPWGFIWVLRIRFAAQGFGLSGKMVVWVWECTHRFHGSRGSLGVARALGL